MIKLTGTFLLQAFIDHQPEPGVPPTSYTYTSYTSSENLPPLPATPPPFDPSSLPPLPSTPPPSLPAAPPPYSEKPTLFSNLSKTPNKSDEAFRSGETNMGCVTSKPDVETGEKNPSYNGGKTTIVIPAAEVSLNLKGSKILNVENKYVTHEEEDERGDEQEEKPQTIVESKSIKIQDTREVNVNELSFDISQILEESEKENGFEAEEDLTAHIEEVKEPTTQITIETEDVFVNGESLVKTEENLKVPKLESSDDVAEREESHDEEIREKVVEKHLDNDPKTYKLDVSEENVGSTIPNTKKQGVSAESGRTKVKSAKEIQITRFEKDAASRELIRRGLQENEFLNFGLDSEAIVEAVVDAMFLKNIPSGCRIINEGEAGMLYVL